MERICPQGWLDLRREWRVSSPQPLPLSILPLRLAAPLPLCCTLASARWIFLAVPILLPPVRAVLEPAKWLSFKPRAAGRAVAKPRRPLLCCSGSSLGSKSSCHRLSSGQALLSPTTTPPDPSSPPQASAPHDQAAKWGTGRGVHSCPHHHAASSPQPRVSIPFPSPTSCGIPQFTAPQSLPQSSTQKG